MCMPSAPKSSAVAPPPPVEKPKPLGTADSGAAHGLAQLRLATRNPLAIP